MPSVKNTPDKKQEEVRRACLQWELQQERHLSIFQRVTSFFFYSLQPPSTAPATGASLVRKSSVLRAASALGIINEKPQPIVYTPRRAWITQPTTVSKTWVFGHSFVQINRKWRGRKKTNLQKNNFNRSVPILNKKPDQQKWFCCIYKSFLFSYGVDIGGFQVVKVCFWRGPSINTAPFRFSFFG